MAKDLNEIRPTVHNLWDSHICINTESSICVILKFVSQAPALKWMKYENNFY